MSTISASVGRGGANHARDVRLIQELINRQLPIPLLPLEVDGKIDPATIGAIEEYQRRVAHMAHPDGRVDPGGKTLQALRGMPPTPTPAVVVTPATPFMDRVKAFIDHAKQHYGISIGVNSSTREPLWQQRMHVAHMIKFNSFAHQKPKKHKIIGGHALIDFAHLSDPKVVWGGSVRSDEFLRDSQGRTCTKKANGSGWSYPPDEAKTRAQALQVLKSAGIATDERRLTEPHSAMVACGVYGCAEPCLCGGNRSKHLAGVAVDLNRAALGLLTTRLSPPTDSAVDRLLADYGLHRPMASEPHHVEAKN